MTDPKKKYAYITREFYEAALNVDLVAEDQLEQFDRAVYYASALLNAFTGHRIEGIGFDNLSEIQQGGVREATVFQVAHFLTSGELDGQRGSASYAGGGQAFSFSMPGEANKVLRIDEKAIFALQQVGLLNTIVGVDPLTERRKQQEKSPDKPKYHRWGIGAMDESLFVSDGTTEDGGTVGLKISNKFQAEIDKSSIVSKQGNHLNYHNTFGSYQWPNNALVHRGFLKEHYPNNKQLRKEWDKFWLEITEIIERLKIDFQDLIKEENKRFDLIDEAFSGVIKALKKEIYDLLLRIVSRFRVEDPYWVEVDWFKVSFDYGVPNEKFPTLVLEAPAWLSPRPRNYISDIPSEVKGRILRHVVEPAVEGLEEKVENNIVEWLLKELEKDKYHGKPGEDGKDGKDGEGITDNLRTIDYLTYTSTNREMFGIRLTPETWTTFSAERSGWHTKDIKDYLYRFSLGSSTEGWKTIYFSKSEPLGHPTIQLSGGSLYTSGTGLHGAKNHINAHSGQYNITQVSSVNTSYLYIDGNVRQSLKEVVEAAGLGTVERKELTPDKVFTYTDHEGEEKTEIAKGTGEWVLKDNYFKELQSQVANLQAKVTGLETQLTKKGVL